jgi:hypothetical protein
MMKDMCSATLTGCIAGIGCYILWPDIDTTFAGFCTAAILYYLLRILSEVTK